MKRFSIDFSDEAYQYLEAIANDLGVCKADALRKMLGLMRFVLTEKKNGGTLQIVYTDGRKKNITGL